MIDVKDLTNPRDSFTLSEQSVFSGECMAACLLKKFLPAMLPSTIAGLSEKLESSPTYLRLVSIIETEFSFVVAVITNTFRVFF